MGERGSSRGTLGRCNRDVSPHVRTPALGPAMTQAEGSTIAVRDDRPGPADLGRVSVIVPHLNDYDNLNICLSLLDGQSFPRTRTEVIVADNGSSRGIDVLRAIVGSRGRVVEAAERGAGPARNAGVRASAGDALAFLDSDCRPDPRWLEQGLAELRHGDFVGGRVDVFVRDPQRMTAAEAFESVFAFHNERYVKELGFTVTASMFVWRSVFDAVGGFENGVPEDRDWCARAGRMGYRLRYAPKSIVVHPARRTASGTRQRVSPGRLTLRRDHLLLGEAQNRGAIALAGRPGSLEAIDRCAGQPKIVVALRAPVRLH